MQISRPVAFDNTDFYDLDQPSADAKSMMAYWNTVDAVLSGADAIKAAGALYLPKFPDETRTEYAFRLSLGKFTNVFRDIVENLASRPFSTPVKCDETKLPSQLKDFILDVDGSGNDLTVFVVDTFFNGIASALDWIFVDYPNAPVIGQTRSVAEEKQLGLRPFWTHVRAANMLEVRSEIMNGSEELKYVRILEPVDSVTFVRIIERGADGVTWKLYRKIGETGKRSKFALENEGVISIGIIPLVPFVTGRRNGRTWRFFPPMRDALDLQINLYQNETALEYIGALAGYPMLSGNGVKPALDAAGKPLPVRVGPGRMLYAPPDGTGAAGSWSYVEPSATSMTFLAAKIKDTITQLRELGRQPLTSQSGNLTVITTAVAAQKGNSAVQMWAHGEENAFEEALMITALWYGVGTIDPDVTIHTDFDVDGEGAEQLTTLNTMREKRDISQETYWAEMRRRGVLGPDFDPEAEKLKLLEETPGDEFDNPDDPNDKGNSGDQKPDPNEPELPGV